LRIFKAWNSGILNTTMSDAGTSLESLESGNVANAADEARMAAILRDMQVTDEPTQRDPMPSNIPMAPMHPNPPAMNSQGTGSQYGTGSQHGTGSQYVPVDEADEAAAPTAAPLKKRGNIWSRILANIRDPLIVVILMFVLSLPGFHTVVAKVVPWAFAVGGELSYLGLIIKSLFAGGLFAALQIGASFI
jgi:hypothetical protein